MGTEEFNALPTLHLKEVKEGDVLIADAGFPCIKPWAELTVEKDADGQLFVPCRHGKHALSGQRNMDDSLSGMKRKP